ncbi:MAG: PHP domain-containing protein [Promethearchaeati archaeon]
MPSNSVFKIDLHLHSYHSDCGGQSVRQIFSQANKMGLDVISLTDHNTFSGVMKSLELGEIFGIKVIPGVELSTGINISDKKIIERRDVLVYFPNVERFKIWAEKGFDRTTQDIFSSANDREHDKYLWGNLPIEEAFQWARNNNGTTILAHPGYYNEETPEKLMNLFRKGLNGLEIFNLKYNNYQHYSKKSLTEVMYYFLNKLKEIEKNISFNKKPIATIGTDSHTPDSIGYLNINEQFIIDFLSYYNNSKREELKNSYDDLFSAMTKKIINLLDFNG